MPNWSRNGCLSGNDRWKEKGKKRINPRFFLLELGPKEGASDKKGQVFPGFSGIFISWIALVMENENLISKP